MVFVIGPKESYDNPYRELKMINTTSRSKDFGRGLSPFFLKPFGINATNVENVWQYSKVYKEYLDKSGKPSEKYFKWREDGFNNPRAIRYPMGKGAIPEYRYWKGEQLGYIEARKKIYLPVYANSVIRSDAYKQLFELYRKEKNIVLWDFDGYDYHSMMIELEQVINIESKSMGHAFVIAMLLERKLKPL